MNCRDFCRDFSRFYPPPPRNCTGENGIFTNRNESKRNSKQTTDGINACIVVILLGALLETTRKRGFLCAQANLYAVPYNTALGALLETTRKRGFFVRTGELVCRSLQYGPGRTFRNHAKAWFFVHTSEVEVCNFQLSARGRL